MENAIGKGKADQRAERPAILAHGLQRTGQRPVKHLLVHVDPLHQRCEGATNGKGRLGRADAERRLRVGDTGHGDEADGDGGKACPAAQHETSSRVAKSLVMSVPVGSLKKASVSEPWFCEITSSGSGRTI
ncbi:hypothetical protein D3C86_1498360 [compost metagenome]